MKILIITPIFPPEIGGPATYTLEVSKRFKERGHQVLVVAFTNSKPQLKDLEVLPLKFDYKILGTIFRQASLFFTVLFASRGMELIYLQDPMVVGLCSLIAGKLIRKPVVLKFVGDSTWEKEYGSRRTDKDLESFLQFPEAGIATKVRFRLQKFVFNKVDKIVVPSYFLREVLTKYYHVNPVKIRVIYNSVDLEDFEKVARKNLREFKRPIITVGRLVRHKRIDRIIRAVKQLAEVFPYISLLIVGEGPERKNLEKLSEELGVTGRVKFHGSASREETIKLLHEAELFLLNSIYEGQPHSVIEAMACRTPVIATNIKGTNEVIEDGETGLLVNPDSDEELKDKMIQLLKDDRLIKKIVENAYRKVSERFTWEQNLGILEKELEKVI